LPKAAVCALALAAVAVGCRPSPTASRESSASPAVQRLSHWNMKDKVIKTEEEWSKTLTPEQFRVLRKKGTERAFSGALWDNHEPGAYLCAACGLELFNSEHKFESGTGWPSFYQPVQKENVATEEDNSLFAQRTEVHCPRCGGHLGHVFEDGPRPTGLRYCINSAALKFEKKQ
jgi:peptide-methionine (R)-S-oxide reductase